MCAKSQEAIELVPVTLPNGETVYMRVQEALAANTVNLIILGIESLTDWLATIGPARVLLWTGTSVLLLMLVAAAAESPRKKR